MFAAHQQAVDRQLRRRKFMTLRIIHRIIVVLVFHLALFGAMAVNCSAQLFPAPVTYDSGGRTPGALAVADFNGDGIQDIAVISHCEAGTICSDTGSSFGILLGNSDGTFQATQTYNAIAGAAFIAAGDVNGDGKIDLAVANQCGGGGSALGCRIDVLLGNGDGSFQPPTTYSLAFPGPITFIALADLNGDRRADLVVTSCVGPACQPVVEVLLSDATGTLQVSNTYVEPGNDTSGFIQITDMNGDGIPDLVVLNHCVFADCQLEQDLNSNVIVLFGKGDGTFIAGGFGGSGRTGTSVAVADLNHDGLQDLIVTNPCGNAACSGGGIAVFLGNLDGSYQDAQTYISDAIFPRQVVVADVNQDGVPDLVGAADGGPNGSPAGKVEVLLGNGDGTFQPAQNYDSGGDNPQFIAIGDFNRDGEPDVVVVNEFAHSDVTKHGTIGVLLNGVVEQTDTTLAALPVNPVYAQTVILTASVVSAGHPAPTGTVTFLDGATPLDTRTLVSGQAFLNLVLPLGTHSLTVSYPGSGNFHASSSTPLSLTVSKAGTQTTLTSSLNPSLVGQSVTFTATIAPASGTGPTGTVSFLDGAKLLASVPVSGGAAVLNTSSLKQATHSITATYSGDGNFTVSTSDVLSQLVEAATTTSLISSLNPSVFGQQVILTATVTAAGATPKGSVTFTANSKSLGNVKLAGGTATLGTTGLKVGSSEIIATFNGSAGFLVSSGALVQTVSGATTSTAITGSSLNPSTYGDVVTFTAVVSSSGGTPTGNVRFKAGSTLLGTATLSNGLATLTTSPGLLPGGADSIVATYNGTAQFTASTSPGFLQTVNQAASTTTLTSSANPASLGQAITFTATVGGASAIPAGKVRFRDGTTSLGVVSLNNGVAVYTTSALSRKTHNVSATYEGNLNYLTSAADVQQVVR
jgi:hypothetical protein